MREIKFRAWDKADLCMCNVLEMRFDNEELIKVGYTFDGSDDIEKACLRYPSQLELMQYTGLKDKNGKEIYEGDVVRCFNSDESKYRAVVEWEHAGFIFHWNSSNNYNEGVLHKTPPMLHTHIDTEVIGNVYESPELIKTT